MIRKHWLAVLVCTVTTGALCHSPARAGDRALPTGEEVLDRFVEQVGGASAIAAARSFHVTGSYELPAFGLAGTVELSYAAPDRLLFDVRIPNLGRSARGTNGVTFWSLDPREGAKILEGDDAGTVRKWLARGFSLLPRRDSYSAVGDVRLADCGGRECYEVDLVLAEGGHRYRERYDVETGLLVERSESSWIQGQDVPVEGWVSGYRWFGDLRVGTVWKHRAAGQEWTATYESLEFNTEPEAFELPAEVRALLAEPDPSGAASAAP